MNIKQKKSLYESIMKSVSKEVKSVFLNESLFSDIYTGNNEDNIEIHKLLANPDNKIVKNILDKNTVTESEYEELIDNYYNFN